MSHMYETSSRIKRDVLFGIEYKIENGGRECKAQKVQQLIVQRQRSGKIREPQKGEDDHDEACEYKEPLGDDFNGKPFL
jgi:hypothetical protein